MAQVTVIIDPNTCISAANCVGIAPDLFQIGSEPYVEVLDQNGKPQGVTYTFDATPQQMELLEEAAECCPTRAIRLEGI